MIDNLKIQNFRLFESLDVQGIKRVNLIVGKNNAGKSALLEALYLYCHYFSPFYIYKILAERQEFHNVSSDKSMIIRKNSPLRYLFLGREIPLSLINNIRVESSEFSFEFGVKKTLNRLRDIEEILALNELFIFYDKKNSQRQEYSIPIHKSSPEAIVALSQQWLFNETPIQYLPTKGISDSHTLRLWDSISLTSAQDDVIKAFHIIEPKLTGLSFVAADSETNSRIPIIKLNDMPEPIPLKSLGDGMTRLFHLILSLVTAKDGVLLIDEFENGLHWSTQSKAWQLIFTLAEQWNVQVFCTTHSKDCINGFEEIWTQHPQNAAFFRLYRKDNQSYIKTYDLEMLSDAIETETEVR